MVRFVALKPLVQLPFQVPSMAPPPTRLREKTKVHEKRPSALKKPGSHESRKGKAAASKAVKKEDPKSKVPVKKHIVKKPTKVKEVRKVVKESAGKSQPSLMRGKSSMDLSIKKKKGTGSKSKKSGKCADVLRRVATESMKKANEERRATEAVKEKQKNLKEKDGKSKKTKQHDFEGKRVKWVPLKKSAIEKVFESPERKRRPRSVSSSEPSEVKRMKELLVEKDEVSEDSQESEEVGEEEAESEAGSEAASEEACEEQEKADEDKTEDEEEGNDGNDEDEDDDDPEGTEDEAALDPESSESEAGEDDEDDDDEEEDDEGEEPPKNNDPKVKAKVESEKVKETDESTKAGGEQHALVTATNVTRKPNEQLYNSN